MHECVSACFFIRLIRIVLWVLRDTYFLRARLVRVAFRKIHISFSYVLNSHPERCNSNNNNISCDDLKFWMFRTWHNDAKICQKNTDIGAENYVCIIIYSYIMYRSWSYIRKDRRTWTRCNSNSNEICRGIDNCDIFFLLLLFSFWHFQIFFWHRLLR